MYLKLLGFAASLCLILKIFNFSTVSAQTENSSFNENSGVNESNSERDRRQEIFNSNDLIHFGDLIEIDVVGSIEYDWRGKLNPEGFLSGVTYLEDPIYALCSSEDKLAQEIARNYYKFLANPQIVVRILDKSGRPQTVLNGAVKTPARFQIERPVKLSELLINSGGLSESASGEIEILRIPGSACSASEKEAAAGGREAKTLTIKIAELIAGDELANPHILSGDYITVKKAQPIYIIGNIIEPRKLDSRANLTISQAVASAGGFAKNSDLNKILIYRLIEGQTKVIEVNFQKMQSNDENDIKLQPLDIVEVLAKGSSRKPVAPVIDNEGSNLKNANLPLKIIR